MWSEVGTDQTVPLNNVWTLRHTVKVKVNLSGLLAEALVTSRKSVHAKPFKWGIIGEAKIQKGDRHKKMIRHAMVEK